PVFVPLDIEISVCVLAGYFRADVKQALIAAFRGFFHPDNFTFGQPVFLSQIYALAQSVAGVESVLVTRFQRWGKTANQELGKGVLTPAGLEIVRLDNDPNFPENGKLEWVMNGGL
ncbi:MAG TPA: putative baseplate assembly protein, partial [Solibacterales bacterium]|nr:putative baseplate assembly protein [Bryobacterales bacterium]